MRARIFTGLTLALAVALGGFLSGQGHSGSAEQQLILTAKHIEKAPVGLDDPVWQKVEPVEVPVKGRESFAEEEVMVTTKAVYTDDSIYFLFKWKDPTEPSGSRRCAPPASPRSPGAPGTYRRWRRE